ncbi:PQQ-like beta-propeller repeat protein [Dictyobacter arantiisoli]|uniref:Outer membrane protein assembly factor BamB n=1 Tax=Dictyobacter arantiisoli TaxID=2014874 RepID=A0A5A5TIM4_9CHLR|nr:PQQ-like beta-propeller repeat protein [Dictyobacter arantiisoli]GCF11257.1 outer membrane protein assembly factor BamB [Dictyobacter arantiisoli]
MIPAKSTPQDLYIGYKDAVYRLSGQNGSVVWQHPLQQPSRPNRIIGSSMQVQVMNDNLICVMLEHTVYVLNGSNGKELWHYAVILTLAQQAETRASIMNVVFDKKQLYIQLADGGVLALNMQTGVQLWKDAARFPNGASITVSDDTLYAKATSTQGVPIIYAIDSSTGRDRWHFEGELWGNSSFDPPSVVDGVLYYAGNPLYALDAHTGKKLWEQRLPDRSSFFDNLHLLNGCIYANTDAINTGVGTVGGLQKVSLNPFKVFAFESKTGKALWHSQAGYHLPQKLLVSGDAIVIQSMFDKDNHETLQILDSQHGVLRWQTTLLNQPCTTEDLCLPPLTYIVEGKLLILDDSQPLTLQEFDMQSGKKVAQHPVSLPTRGGTGESLVSNGYLYVQTGTHEGGAYVSGSSNTFWNYTIYAINLTNGKTAWQYKIGKLLEYQEPISALNLVP